MTNTIIAAAAIIAMLTGAAGADAMRKQTNVPILGEWTETEDKAITPDMQEMFDQAMEKLIGVDYTAIELIETQLVNGTNYKFRCEAQVVYPGAEKKEAIVTIHKDLQGNLSILNIEAE
ncbi:MAG: hypothetical protein Q4C20_14480 [Erysipelotrichaceae bacterium]|nr:hypothetical protein [Erysipelotrichaceae bacterium]